MASSKPEPPVAGAAGELIDVLLGSCEAALDRGDIAHASRCAEQALALTDTSRSASAHIRALALLGSARRFAGADAEAAELWRQCLALQIDSGDRLGAATTLCGLAEIASRRGEWALAKETLLESLRLSSGVAPGPHRASALEEFGLVRRLLGEHEQALEAFEEALRIRESLDDRPSQARVLNRLGNTYQKMGRLGESLDRHSRSLQIWEALEERLEMGKSLNNIGSTFLEKGDYAAAADCFEKAKALFEELGERPMLAHVLSNLGLLRDYTGDAREAETFLRRSLAIREELNDRVGQANCLNNLANVAHMTGRFAEAIGWARRSIQIRAELGQQEGLSKPWFNLAESLIEVGRITEAEDAAREVESLAERSGNSETLSEAAILRAAVLLKRVDAPAALEAARAARDLAARGGHRRQQAQAFHLMGHASLLLDDLDGAREALLAAEGLFRDLQAHHLLALTRFTLGKLFLRAGLSEAAAERLRRTAEAFQRMGNALLNWESLIALAGAEWTIDRSQARSTLRAAAELAWRLQRGDLAERTEAYQRELESRDETSDVSGRDPLLGILAAATREAADPRAACESILRILTDRLELTAIGVIPRASMESTLARAVSSAPLPPPLSRLADEAMATRRAAITTTQTPGGDPIVFVAVPIHGLGGTLLGVLAAACAPIDRPAAEADAPTANLADLETATEYLGLLLQLQSESPLASLPADPDAGQPFEGLVGSSASMRKIASTIRTIAASEASVLIQGASGTGKELVARAVHNLSGRRMGPFVAISCPSIPKELIESELFGHEKGAFTGAHTARAGRIEAADGGTLFLDEIGDMSAPAQSKLLRFLQEREFERLGGRAPIRVDVRLVAATSRDLDLEIREGRFREDLYYRIGVVPVRLPALRDRVEDIPLLVAHFLREFAERTGRTAPSVRPDAMDHLCRYAWPGNVRELRNLIEYLIAMEPGIAITSEMIPLKIRTANARIESLLPDASRGDEGALLRRGETLDARLLSVEGDLIRRALERCEWNQSLAARMLGITETRIRHRIRRYGIARPGEEGGVRARARRPRRRDRGSRREE